jgi:hypothetical protein
LVIRPGILELAGAGRGRIGLVRVFLVMPDLSEAKVEALRLAASRGVLADLLVSATIVAWKPSVESRLAALRAGSTIGSVMLDSGAYHHARGEAEVSVEWYARLASRLHGEGLVDYIVAPDVPGDPRATLERTIEFTAHYPGSFIPVAQPPPGKPDPKGHAGSLEALARHGLIDKAPQVEGGRRLVGIGGLDGPLRRAPYLASLVEEVEREWGHRGIALHLFGVGARLLKSLARRGLAGIIYSIDSTAWLAEIKWRRRTVYNATTTLEANLAAITGYIAKVATATTT